MRKIEWTDEEVEILVKMYRDSFARDISPLVNKTIYAIYRKAKELGLKSSDEKLQRCGRMVNEHPKAIASRFQKGHSYGKGRKMTEGQYAKCKATMFKKGQIPPNLRAVGSERVNVDGYIEVKVQGSRKWKLKHRVVWENANGPIPKGYNVQFKDKNKQNTDLDNLYLISRSEQMKKENSIHARYPEELRAVIAKKVAIKRYITMQNKKKNEQSKSRVTEGASV